MSASRKLQRPTAERAGFDKLTMSAVVLKAFVQDKQKYNAAMMELYQKGEITYDVAVSSAREPRVTGRAA